MQERDREREAGMHARRHSGRQIDKQKKRGEKEKERGGIKRTRRRKSQTNRRTE